MRVRSLCLDCSGIVSVLASDRGFRIVPVDTATIGHRFYIRIQMTLVKSRSRCKKLKKQFVRTEEFVRSYVSTVCTTYHR